MHCLDDNSRSSSRVASPAGVLEMQADSDDDLDEFENAFDFEPGFVVYLVHEKFSKGKHQQLLSGISPVMY